MNIENFSWQSGTVKALTTIKKTKTALLQTICKQPSEISVGDKPVLNLFQVNPT